MLVKRKNKAMNSGVNVNLDNECTYKISHETNFFAKLERKKKKRDNVGGKEVSVYNRRVY